MYEVNVDVGYCTCQRGRTGAFCKHQCFLYKKLGVQLPNVPTLNINDKVQLVYIATGTNNLNIEFYQNSEEMDVPMPSNVVHENLQTPSTVILPNVENEATAEKKQELLKEFTEMLMAPQSNTTVNRLIAVFKTKKTPEAKKSCLTTMALAVSARNYKQSKEKIIKRQPTSLCRHIPRTLCAKRKHNLSENIHKNISNPK